MNQIIMPANTICNVPVFVETQTTAMPNVNITTSMVLVDSNGVPLNFPNTTVTPTNTPPPPIPYASNTLAHIEEDYAYARNNIYEMMKLGIKAMEELANIATASQHMRAYEAMAQLLKSVGETNDKLLVLQNNRQALEDQEDVSKTNKVININSGNTVFVGTTQELAEMISKKTGA